MNNNLLDWIINLVQSIKVLKNTANTALIVLFNYCAQALGPGISLAGKPKNPAMGYEIKRRLTFFYCLRLNTKQVFYNSYSIHFD